MLHDFHHLGITHRVAPLTIREQFAISNSNIRGLIASIQSIFHFEDLLVLATCNRTEIYYTSRTTQTEGVIDALCGYNGVDGKGVRQYFELSEGQDAVRHLLSVSLGLDARIPGDIQISNQVKRAYEASNTVGASGSFLHRLMQFVMIANKRVMKETAFRDGALSTSYASVRIAKQFLQNFHNPKVLVLGLGEIGEDVLRHLRNKPYRITVATRNPQKAINKGQEYGVESLSLPSALSRLCQFDAIISSLNSSKILIESNMIAPESITQQLLIDLSVPRSISDKLNEQTGVILYNLDQLEDGASEVLENRKSAIPHIQQIIDETLEEFGSWTQYRAYAPTIKRLKQTLEQIARAEVDRVMKKTDNVTASALEEVTEGIVQKVLKLQVLGLKAASNRGNANVTEAAISNLFRLKD